MPTLPERLTAVLADFDPRSTESYDAIDALYAEDVVFVDPLQRVEGRAAFRAMNERLFRRARYVRFEDLAPVGDEPHFMIAWTMVFRAKLGPELRIPGVSELRSRRGLIVHQRDHWDLLGSLAGAFPAIEPIYKRLTALFG